MKTSFESPPPPVLQRFSLNGATMGTRYTAVFYAAADVDAAAIGACLFAAVDQVDRQMSSWNPASDLCRVNAAPDNTWIAIPDELAEVLEAGLQVGAASKGAFDIGLGALVEAWGFGPARRPLAAPPPARNGTQAGVGAAGLEVDRKGLRVRKHRPVCLDLSGIAKGYGVDRLAQCLDRWGVTHYLVGIDGEMRSRGAKPGGEAWTVAIEKPVYGIREVIGAIELTDTAIATSGDYRRWVDLGGKRFSHTMDAATQQPIKSDLAGVTVLAPTCMLADAWATALLVLGLEQGSQLTRELGMDALFIWRDGGTLREVWIAGK
ncbi:FAD:protein FMN transferase [Duganella caerulea]